MVRFIFPKIVVFFLLFSLVMIIPSCEKARSDIPYEYVNEEIYVNSPQYTTLYSNNGYLIISGGAYNNGIIIYKRSEYDYSAYDMSCPYDHAKGGKIMVNPDWGGSLVEDTLCGSQFLLSNETIFSGPASHFLREYNTIFESKTGMLYITN